MSVRQFQPGQKADGAPRVQQMLPTAASTFKIGVPVRRNAGDPNKIEAHPGGATVTGIIGVAGAGVASGIPEAKGSIAYGTTIPVYKAESDVTFLGQVTDGADAHTVAGDGSIKGRDWGFVVNSGEATVDIGDAVDVVLRVIEEYPEINMVAFKFLASAVAD